jgi:hypothetical protein
MIVCFTCNVCLVCWEKTDEPWSEHDRHSPECPFMKGKYIKKMFEFIKRKHKKSIFQVLIIINALNAQTLKQFSTLRILLLFYLFYVLFFFYLKMKRINFYVHI